MVLVTHESFVMSEELQKQFEEESGYDLVVQAAGDAGALTNKLVLTKDDPIGDVVFGIDNTFGVARGRRGRAGAVRRRRCPTARRPTRSQGDDDHDLTPVDNGNVCVNVDDTWFADHGVPTPPTTLDDLTKPGVQGPVRHARRDHELARAGLPARHDRGVRRRTAGRTTGAS